MVLFSKVQFLEQAKLQFDEEIESTQEFEVVHALPCKIIIIYEEDWRDSW